MGQPAAERQRAYRNRHLGAAGGKRRLQVILPTTTWFALRLLAHHAGVGVADYLVDLVDAESRRVTADMPPDELLAFTHRLP